MKVVINGISNNVAGGKSVLANLVDALNALVLEDDFIVLTTRVDDFSHINNPKIFIQKFAGSSSSFAMPFNYCVALPRLLKKIKPDCLLNLGDLVVTTRISQVYLFDWAYLTAKDPEIYKRMTIKESVVRRIKAALIKATINIPKIVCAQTETARIALQKQFGLKDVQLVPNAVTNTDLKKNVSKEFRLPGGFKFLALSRYYRHKNLEIIIPTAEKIRDAGLKIKIVITIASGGESNRQPCSAKLNQENSKI